MPTLEQLPQVVTANPADCVLLEQAGETCVVSVEALLEPVQPRLTLASGVLLGRASVGPGGPEPIGVGEQLAIREGRLVLDAAGVAPLDSPVFTGTPQGPTPPALDASRALATTEYVQAQLLDKATVALGARLPAIDGSDVHVTRYGGIGRSLADSFSDCFDVRAFGARADGQRPAGAAAISAGGTELRVSGAEFSVADIGKLIAVNGAGPRGATLATRIIGIAGDEAVTLAAPAVTTVAGRTCAVCYGNDDAPAIAAALAQAAASGGEVVFPPGIYALGSQLVLPERGSVCLVGAGPGASELVALATMAGGMVGKGTAPHRNAQIVDLRMDANALAPYALDVQCAENYRIDRVILSNGLVAGLRLGDGVNVAQGMQVAHSRIDNDGSVFGTPALLPPYNVVVNGTESHFIDVALVNAATANLRDVNPGNNSYVILRAHRDSDLPGAWEAQYGFWIGGSAVLLGCEVDGVRALATVNSVDGVDGAGIRIDGRNVRVIGAKVQNLFDGAVGILLTADAGGNAPGNCYIAGNQIDVGPMGVADATRAVVQYGVAGAGTIIVDNPGAALRQGTPGVVPSGVQTIAPAGPAGITCTVAPTDPQTLCLADITTGDVVLKLPANPNLGVRYRIVRLPSAGGAGALKIRPAGGPADGSGDVAVLRTAAAFAEVEWTGASWLMTAQGSLDSTQISLSGGLKVMGSTALQAATGVTPTRSDNSPNLATTAFVKAQGYLAASNNFSDLASTAAARTALGLGSLALQDAGSVAVTGGTVNGTVIGAAVPAAGTFTTLTASKVTLLGGSGVSETGDYVNFSSTNGLAAQFYVAAGQTGYLFSNANNGAVTLMPGQTNADLVLRGNGTGTVRTSGGLLVNGGTLTASAVAISAGSLDAVTLGTTNGVGAIKGTAKAQLFEAAWELGPFAAAGGPSATDTLTLVNASNGHLALWSPDKTMGWGLHIDVTNGNLRLSRTAGSGGVALGNGAAVTVGGNLTVSGTMSLGTAASRLGFFGAAGQARPTVTGARAGNGALASLLAALAALGLIVDGSTA